LFLQHPDAAAQFLEFVLGRGMDRSGKGREHKQQRRASFNSENGDGCGSSHALRAQVLARAWAATAAAACLAFSWSPR